MAAAAQAGNPTRIHLVATIPGTDTFFTVTGLSVGTHDICVKAYDSTGALLGEDCCTVAVVAPVQLFTRADCNADGLFNVADVISLLNFLFLSSFTPPCDDACDMNDSGTINIGDAIFALNNLFGTGSPIPAPHPLCGPDPTTDALGCASFPPCP